MALECISNQQRKGSGFGGIMHCPKCGRQMQSGVTVVKAKPTLWGMATSILARYTQHLWFVPADSSGKAALSTAKLDSHAELVQNAYQTATAHFCSSCRVIVIEGRAKPSS
jgi:hypothetical protein